MVSTRSQTSTPTRPADATSTSIANGSPSKKRKAEGNGSLQAAKRHQDEKTDYSRWRLRDERGRQTWHFLETDEEMKAWEQSVADKYMLGLETVGLIATNTQKTLLIFRRVYLISLLRASLSSLPRTLSNSSRTFSYHLATGAASMAVPCSSSQAWSSLAMSPRTLFLRHSRRK